MNLSLENRDRLIGLASPVLLLLLWEAGADSGWIDPRFFPAPSTIAGTFLHLASSGELWDNLSASLARLLFGFVIGGVPALLLGLAMGLYRPVRALVDPLLTPSETEALKPAASAASSRGRGPLRRVNGTARPQSRRPPAIVTSALRRRPRRARRRSAPDAGGRR